jgi:hypothetical protein
VKVVINACYGGFSLSDEATLELRKLGNECALREVMIGEKWPNGEACTIGDSNCRQIARDDAQLIDVVGRLGEKASGAMARLRVVDVPDGAQWEIAEYDGYEHVAEKHRTWS